MDKKIAVAALVLILILVNASIIGKQQHLAEGRIVYLELAPVDPRSLMQGDYMALRFHVANDLRSALRSLNSKADNAFNMANADGYVIVTLDDNKVGRFSRVDRDREQTLNDNEIRLRYRIRGGVIKFATNAFFFQEGQAKTFETARYGQFRVDDNGELLLTAMYDAELSPLPAQP